MHFVARFSANLLPFVLSAILFAAATAAHGADSFITVSQFKEDLRSRNYDAIIKSFNSIKAMNYQGEILPFMKDLWGFRQDRHPDLPWEIIRSPVMRVEIADVLIQASRNELVEIDDTELRHAVKEFARSDDVYVKSEAIDVLGIIDDPEDVPMLLGIGMETRNTLVFKSVVASLAKMCSEGAKGALDELETSTTNQNWKSDLRATRKRFEDFFLRTNGAWCASQG